MMKNFLKIIVYFEFITTQTSKYSGPGEKLSDDNVR